MEDDPWVERGVKTRVYRKQAVPVWKLFFALILKEKLRNSRISMLLTLLPHSAISRTGMSLRIGYSACAAAGRSQRLPHPTNHFPTRNKIGT